MARLSGGVWGSASTIYGSGSPFGLAARVVGLWADEHIAPEEALPGGFGGDFDREVVIAVLTHVKMGDKPVAVGDMCFNALPEGVEFGFVEGAVYATPVDAVLGARLADHEAVSGGAPGALAGGDKQGPGVGQHAFAPFEGLFDK